MARVGFIFLGHSHLSSIVGALATREGETFDPDYGCEHFVFDTMKYGASFQFSVPDEHGGYVLNPDIVQLVNERVPAGYKKVFVSMFGGNAHNALTLLEHPQPFDFILPENPDLARVDDTQLLPSQLIERFVGKLAEPYMLNLATLKNAFPEEILHVESPPPIGNDVFVMENLDQYFKGQYEDPRPAPRALRYKLWRLHSQIIRNHAEALGVMMLEAPSESMDREGFLLPEDYANDATHAGPHYGLRILKQLEARELMPYGGWSWL